MHFDTYLINSDLRSMATLAAAIEGVLIPPKFGRYPLVEEVLWRTVQAAMIGALGIDEALHRLTVQISEIVAGEHER
jgi:hypothetical protein